jgi:hypothetical protein
VLLLGHRLPHAARLQRLAQLPSVPVRTAIIRALLNRSGIRLRTWSKAASLRECRSRPSPVSMMADKEDAAPALGETEISRVQHVPTVPVPELPHFPEEGTKVFPAVRGQDLGDVLPQEPSGAEHLCDLKEPEREPSARVVEPLPPPGLREALAGSPADEDVTSDGQHFVFATYPESVSTPLVLVTNWTAYLKK